MNLYRVVYCDKDIHNGGWEYAVAIIAADTKKEVPGKFADHVMVDTPIPKAWLWYGHSTRDALSVYMNTAEQWDEEVARIVYTPLTRADYSAEQLATSDAIKAECFSNDFDMELYL